MGKFLDYVLGGASSPMAGDGYGLTPSPAISPVVGSGEHFGSDRSRSSSATTSRNPSPIPPDHTRDGRRNGNPEQLGPKKIWQKPALSPNGVRAPRCSLAVLSAVTAPPGSPRTSMESFRTASEESTAYEVPELPKEVPWQDHEIPIELELIKDDTPKEIRNVVQESMDEHRAIRASRLQSQAIVVRTTIETSGTLRKNDRAVIAESSAMASARSTPSSEYSTSSLSIPLESETSLESDAEDSRHLQPPPKVLGQSVANSSQESLRAKEKPSPAITEMERRFLESKMRTKKSHKLFKLLPSRKSKGEISPDILKEEPTLNECTSCFDEVPDKKAVGLPCRHKYCSPCFAQLVSTSIQHEANFPPKCCLTDIPKKTIRDNLPPLICAEFEEKALEYAVPIGNRYYCVSSTCGKWIDTRHASRTNGAMECPHCAVKLCTVCRGPQHPSNEDCPQDFGLDRTLEQAERAGWRRCYNCRAMVELNTGCRHITCKCRAEFCYTCGAQWRTCACTEADQARREQEIRTRLAQFEANQRAEEEEVRAAILAVEAAERSLRAEREAEEARLEEEARELSRLEEERINQIALYFGYLRGVLERVHLQQQTAIEKRHNSEWENIDSMRDELESPQKAAEREAHVKTKRDKITTDTEQTIKVLQRTHAATMMETITRHRKDQDDLFARSMESDDQDADIIQAETLQELMPVQDLERTTLKAQQSREIQKWRVRGEIALKEFDLKMIALKMRLEEAEKIDKREKKMRDAVFADDKWSETLLKERYAMVAEDERRLILNGGEAPEAPKRDTVIMPKRNDEVPIVQVQPQTEEEAFLEPAEDRPRREETVVPSQEQAWRYGTVFRVQEQPRREPRLTPLERLMKEAANRPLQSRTRANTSVPMNTKDWHDAIVERADSRYPGGPRNASPWDDSVKRSEELRRNLRDSWHTSIVRT